MRVHELGGTESDLTFFSLLVTNRDLTSSEASSEASSEES
jgi:hypothetical protein